MGSSGYGKFGNYRNEGPGAGQQGPNGGGVNAELPRPFSLDFIRLEDVAASEFFVNRNALPSIGEDIQVRSEIYKGRLVVEHSFSGEIIGNIPTEYNMILLLRIKKGIHYSGRVQSSGVMPIPYVVVSLHE